MSKRDFYEILGISENASADDIKKAYRRLAKQYHPDTHPNVKQAEERFKEISEAHSVLSDPKKRAQYDQMRRLGAFDGAGMGGFRPGGFDFSDLSSIFGGGRRRSSSRRFTFEDFGGLGGLGDIFSQFFDLGDTSRGSGTASRTAGDIQVELEIPFELALHGGKHSFSISKDDRCSSCGGAGGTDAKTCPNCGGSGYVQSGQGFFTVSRPCPSCFGRGTIVNKVCSRCNGSGVEQRKKTYSVKIPAGAQSGQKLRLKRQGSPTGKGGNAGDLVLTLKVRKHSFFDVRGADVYCDVVLDKAHVESGTKVRVKTIDGQKVELKIPAGTKDGTVFRLKGLGTRVDGKKGSQFVRVTVKDK